MSQTSNSIQAYGLEETVEMYRSKSIPQFSICAGRIMNFAYDGFGADDEYIKPTMSEGIQVLLNYLSSMYSRTTAIYTLKVYDDLKANQKIKPSTEYTQAFNFRLNDPGGMMPGMSGGMGMMPYQRGAMYGAQNPFVEEMRLMREELEQLKANQVEEDDEPETWEEVLTGILKDPVKMNQHVNAIKNIFGITNNVQTIGNVLPSVPYSKINDHPQKTEIKTQEEQMKLWERTAAAIDKLAGYVGAENLVGHFETLGRIAEKNPASFQKLLETLALYE